MSNMISSSLFELVTAIGFLQWLPNLFIFITILRSDNLNHCKSYILLFALANADIINGLSNMFAGTLRWFSMYPIHLGVYGAFTRIYGDDIQYSLRPLQCMFRALHITIWIFSDCAQQLLLITIGIDRFISISFINKYLIIATLSTTKIVIKVNIYILYNL